MILSPFARLFGASLLATAWTAAVAPAAMAQQQRPAQQPQAGQPSRTPAPAAKTGTPAKPSPDKSTPGSKAAATPAKPAAAAKPANAPANAPGGGQAVLLASFGDWGVYAAQSGRSKICYALTQPKDRQPKNLTRDPGYLFVSFRPAENVRNEIALVMGFPTKEAGPAEAAVGNATYALLTKEQNAWLRNPAEEGQAINAMSRGQNFVVKAASRRGNATTDRYSLSGFAQALDRARKECP